jgi:murein DD-endopeptidase MepM/ murein hydrolase activator NlpD
MLEERGFPNAARGWRLIAVLAATMLMIAGHLAWDAERRNAKLNDEVRDLRTRVAEKRQVVARQRGEMAEVAAGVERLARATSVLRERAASVRRLARMQKVPDRNPSITTVNATYDGRSFMPFVSEDAGRALEELAWLEGQTTAASDSITLLTVLLKQRAEEMSYGPPSIWPVRGLVTSPFGVRTSPYGEGPEMHAGLDIAAGYGAPVAAAGGGQVVFAGREAGYGGLVIVDHGGRTNTLYGHLSALYVREGQQVRRGQVLGAVGATGRATGAHLHYEVRVNGAPVDPRRYLGAAKPDGPSLTMAQVDLSRRTR